MRRSISITLLSLALTLVFGGSAFADPGTPGVVPVSIFGGTYFAMSEDGTAIAFKMPDGRIRWEINGVPISNYGVNDVTLAEAVGFDDPNVLVLGGAIGGTYFGSSEDGTAMSFKMPDGTIRWELNGVPIFTH
jgi:outer membrane protein assembly factor BamB